MVGRCSISSPATLATRLNTTCFLICRRGAMRRWPWKCARSPSVMARSTTTAVCGANFRRCLGEFGSTAGALPRLCRLARKHASQVTVAKALAQHRIQPAEQVQRALAVIQQHSIADPFAAVLFLLIDLFRE